MANDLKTIATDITSPSAMKAIGYSIQGKNGSKPDIYDPDLGDFARYHMHALQNKNIQVRRLNSKMSMIQPNAALYASTNGTDRVHAIDYNNYILSDFHPEKDIPGRPSVSGTLYNIDMSMNQNDHYTLICGYLKINIESDSTMYNECIYLTFGQPAGISYHSYSQGNYQIRYKNLVLADHFHLEGIFTVQYVVNGKVKLEKSYDFSSLTQYEKETINHLGIFNIL